MSGAGRPVTIAVVLCTILVLWLGPLSIWACAQEKAVHESLGLGTHVFRRLLHARGCEPLRQWGDLQSDPQDKVLIVLGDTDVLQNLDPRQEVKKALLNFVFAGGSLLLATDRLDNQESGHHFGVELNGTPLHVETDSGYRRSQDLIFVKFNSQGNAIFPGITQLATNRPSWLTVRHGISRELPELASYRGNCWIWQDHPSGKFLKYPIPSPPACFAAGGRWGEGRALFLADHSVFINAMFLQEDNQNVAFAQRCIDWLTENGKRKEVLFVEEGEPKTQFYVEIKAPAHLPMPPPEMILDAADGLLLGLEEENRFNQLLMQMQNGLLRTGSDFVPTLLVFLTLGLGLFGLSRLSLNRFRHEIGVPALAEAQAQAIPVRPLVELRSRALVEEGNLWEVAHGIAREALLTLFRGRLPVRPGQKLGLNELLSKVAITGGWTHERHWKRQIEETWTLAYGADEGFLGPKQWKPLEKRLEALRKAVADGRLRAII